ncbi:MAG: hypothetical protein EAX95_04570 [Candidatus Thorarchaeota archaeon]|nr:hypothetical protein [Candidatus Thorarchaeota archaeon]
MNDQELRVKLYEYRGETSVFIDAEINDEGSLVLSGQDVGEAPEKHFGDSDYEYWVVVKEEQKDRVILALIEKTYGGNSKAVSEFMDLMKSKGIPYEFDTWV